MSFERPKFNELEKKSGRKEGPSPQFDREAEKEKRKKIRKMLSTSLSESLVGAGFEKVSESTWVRKSGKMYQVANLQRSWLGNEYFINVGMGSKQDFDKVPSQKFYIGAVPNKRIEHIVAKHEEAKYTEKELQNPKLKKQLEEQINAVRQSLILKFSENCQKARVTMNYLGLQ